MNSLDQLVQSLYNRTDPETADLEIFMKQKLEMKDHYRFFIRVLQDHMIFINTKSKVYADTASQLLTRLTKLKEIIINGGQMGFEQFNENIIEVVEAVRDFKRNILADLLKGPPQILLPPTFISHMLNELEKFRFMIYYYKENGHFPPVNTFNEHELWLNDIAGHLGGIKDNLDGVEKLIRQRLHEQKKIFKALHHKTLEFIGYIKHGVVGGNHQSNLTVKSIEATLLYLNLVNEIRILRESNEALGIVDRHMLVHMIMEEVYYIKILDGAVDTFDPLAAFQMRVDPKSLATSDLIPM